MIVHAIATGPLKVNCYIVGCEETGKAAVIDPGGDSDKIISILEENKLTPIYILLTHGHWDHIDAVGALKERYGAEIGLHRGDEILYLGAEQTAVLFGFSMQAPPPVDLFLKDGDMLQRGEISLKVVHTPGHSQGSVCFVCDGVVFTGDLIFAGAVGRTDFPGGDSEKLYDSINNRIFTLPDDTRLYPGHGPVTTVLSEKCRETFYTDG